MDCEDITGDAATEPTYARFGAMSLTKEQISLIYKDLYTHKIICNIEILEAR